MYDVIITDGFPDPYTPLSSAWVIIFGEDKRIIYIPDAALLYIKDIKKEPIYSLLWYIKSQVVKNIAR